MLTLFHAPNSRSSRIVTLIEEMGIADKVTLHPIGIVRFDGSGRRDPANPHPEGKAPALLHDGAMITESAAIMLHLTLTFPGSGLAPAPGEAAWADYLTWMVWYGSVMEPVLVQSHSGLNHPALTATYRGTAEIEARLRKALAQGPWLLGQSFSAADILVHSPYAWFRDALPADPAIRDWVTRCQARPAVQRMRARDAALMAA